jgi:hypothetical protein
MNSPRASVRYALLILGLHLPLAAYVALLRDMAPAEANVLSLGLLPLLLLAALLILPYTVLAMLRIPWNPARARLGEPDL